jgi:hypothetical protein
MSANDVAMVAAVRAAPLDDDVMRLAPNVISVRHWDRLLGGLLYAVSPRRSPFSFSKLFPGVTRSAMARA